MANNQKISIVLAITGTIFLAGAIRFILRGDTFGIVLFLGTTIIAYILAFIYWRQLL